MTKLNRKKIGWVPDQKGLVLLMVLGIAFSGCAGRKAIEQERMLVASGFGMKLADTPEKLQHLKTLTQRKIVPHKKDGKTFFVYADAKDCKCVYVGNEDVYEVYEDMLQQKQLADEDLMAAETNYSAPMNWDMWGGPWAP
jgi:hypothetical protein